MSNEFREKPSVHESCSSKSHHEGKKNALGSTLPAVQRYSSSLSQGFKDKVWGIPLAGGPLL